MQLDLHFVFACVFDRPLENNLVPINLAADFILQAIDNVLRGDRTESSAGFAGFKRERYSQFSDSVAELFRFVLLARFAFRALLFQIIELPQTRWRDFV